MPISQWASDDRPREKLIRDGARKLSDTEIMAILIGTGTGKFNALEIARQILLSVDHNLEQLGSLEYQDLISFPGIGKAKAIKLLSAIELGRRRNNCLPLSRFKISRSEHVYQLMKPQLLDKKTEAFWVIYLTRAHQLIKARQISQGGVSGTVVDPKLVFKHGLQLLASSMVLVHNHPSGQLRPSEADIQLTRKLISVGEMIEIKVIGPPYFYQFGLF